MHRPLYWYAYTHLWKHLYALLSAQRDSGRLWLASQAWTGVGSSCPTPASTSEQANKMEKKTREDNRTTTNTGKEAEIRTANRYIYIYIYMYIHVFLDVSTGMCDYLNTCVYIHIYIYIYVQMAHVPRLVEQST